MRIRWLLIAAQLFALAISAACTHGSEVQTIQRWPRSSPSGRAAPPPEPPAIGRPDPQEQQEFERIDPEAGDEGAAEYAEDAEDVEAELSEGESRVPLEDQGEQVFDLVIEAEEAERFNTVLPPGPLPMYGAIILHKVSNYDRWRAQFDSELEARKRAGFMAQGVMRGVEDPKLVAVWLAVTDVGRAKAYFADKSRRARLKRAGVIGTPQIQLSSNLDAKTEPGRKGLHAAIIAIRVRELPLFKLAFAAQAEARRAAGLVGYALSQDVYDERIVYVYLQSEQPAQLKAYLMSRETRQAWREAGLTGGPYVKLVRETDLMLCQ